MTKHRDTPRYPSPSILHPKHEKRQNEMWASGCSQIPRPAAFACNILFAKCYRSTFRRHWRHTPPGSREIMCLLPLEVHSALRAIVYTAGTRVIVRLALLHMRYWHFLDSDTVISHFQCHKLDASKARPSQRYANTCACRRRAFCKYSLHRLTLRNVC